MTSLADRARRELGPKQRGAPDRAGAVCGSGGEPAAVVITDAVVRLVPGVLGHGESARSDSFADGLLEYAHYTRPPEFRGMRVPDVLLSGDHAAIARWRRDEARRRTRERRSDLLEEDDTTPETQHG